MVVFPALWRGAGRRFFDPGGRPGPDLPGLGALAGQRNRMLGLRLLLDWLSDQPGRTWQDR